MRETGLEQYASAMSSVPGAFGMSDFRVFQALDVLQGKNERVTGDLLEIGTYQGRSAIVLGFFVQDGEQIHVCEPFPTPTTDDPDFLAHTIDWYDTYTEEIFRNNYLRFHAEPPIIHTYSSTELVGKLESGSFRFVHLDGSHQRDVLRGDVELAKDLLVLGGVIAFSSFRTIHTMEVAAEAWRQVANQELYPVCATKDRLYVRKTEPDSDSLLALSTVLESFEEVSVYPSAFGDYEILLVHPSPHFRPRALLKSLIPPILVSAALRTRNTIKGIKATNQG